MLLQPVRLNDVVHFVPRDPKLLGHLRLVPSQSNQGCLDQLAFQHKVKAFREGTLAGLPGPVDRRPEPGQGCLLAGRAGRTGRVSREVQVLGQDARAAGALFGAGLASEELGQKEQALAYYQRLVALPQSGRERQLLADIQRDAQSRVAALSAPASTAAPKAPPAPSNR